MGGARSQTFIGFSVSALLVNRKDGPSRGSDAADPGVNGPVAIGEGPGAWIAIWYKVDPAVADELHGISQASPLQQTLKFMSIAAADKEAVGIVAFGQGDQAGSYASFPKTSAPRP
jgi:hypothetical protein